MAIPNEVVTIHSSDSPWVTNVLRIPKRKIAHKINKRNNAPYAWRKFRKLRNQSVDVRKKF